jgi:hypothetical protein
VVKVWRLKSTSTTEGTRAQVCPKVRRACTSGLRDARAKTNPPQPFTLFRLQLEIDGASLYLPRSGGKHFTSTGPPPPQVTADPQQGLHVAIRRATEASMMKGRPPAAPGVG